MRRMTNGHAPRLMASAFDRQLAGYHARIEQVLAHCLELPQCGTPRLREAMRYSVLGGGKRLRPVLVYATGEAFGHRSSTWMHPPQPWSLSMFTAWCTTILPAMDDDDLRRGRPTCHRAFDEATAILAGDALAGAGLRCTAAARAADRGDVSAAARLRCCACWRRPSGTSGMAGGQAIDLASVGQRLDARARREHASAQDRRA